jgi:hypothetical protein
MTKAVHLRYEVEPFKEGVSHVVILEGLPDQVRGPRRIFWRAPSVPSLGAFPVLDFFALAVALPVATAGGELFVHGALSSSGMFNILSLLDLRRETSLGRYRRLVITPNEVVSLSPAAADLRSAVIAFSGGVDSTHAAWRHAANADRDDSLRIKALVMVHGFDAALEQPEVYAAMLKRAEKFASQLNLSLVALETNSKALADWLWPQTAVPCAAACLAMFQAEARYGIFGGGLHYGANFLPLGHQPMFDQYCSGDQFSLITDAGGLHRTEKIRAFANYPEAVRSLRVCWAGKDVSRNCGRCERCTQTMINLRSLGIDERPIFEAAFDPANLGTFKTMYEARDLAEYVWDTIKDRPDLALEHESVKSILANLPPDVTVRDVIREALPPNVNRVLRAIRGLPRRLALR